MKPLTGKQLPLFVSGAKILEGAIDCKTSISDGIPIFVIYYSDYYDITHSAREIAEKILKDFSVMVCLVEVNESGFFADFQGISTFPTYVFYREGKERGRLDNAVEMEEVISWFEGVRGNA